jgi:hypothetical protein
MRLPSAAFLILSLVQPAASLGAKPPVSAPTAQGTAVLRQGANALINQASLQAVQPGDASAAQAAEHAALRAIQVVCSKNTPAAQRAAICHPNSPF